MLLKAFIVFFLVIIIKSSYIVLQIKSVVDYKNYNEPSEVIKNKTFPIVQTELFMGTPQQKVKVNLSFFKYYYYIISSKADLTEFPFVNSIFNDNESVTFTKNSNFPDEIPSEYSLGYNSTDIFYFDQGKEIISNKMDFTLAEKVSRSNTHLNNAGILGLSVTHDPLYDDEDPPANFIQNLKRNNIISSYAFSFDFDENLLYIGDYPHSINMNKYQKEDFVFDRVITTNNKLYWGFNFDYIADGDRVVQITNNYVKVIPANISFETEFIFGRSEYNNSVYQNFFKSKIEQKLCQIDTIGEYIYYNCSKNGIDYTKFEPLKFYHLFFNFNFTFTYEDLFFELGNRKYFLVCFEKRPKVFPDPYWTIGTIFLKKYKVVYDQDKKTTGFYLRNDVHKSNDKKQEKTYSTLFWILIPLFIILTFGLIYYSLNLKKKILRRKRATELVEDYIYTQQN